MQFFLSEMTERIIAMDTSPLAVLLFVSLSRFAHFLPSTVLKILEKLKIRALMVGLSNEGVCVISGVKNGFLYIIKKSNSYTMYVHCLAHKVNLLLAACKDND